MTQPAPVAAPRTWRQVGLPFLVLRVAGQASEFAAFIVLTHHLTPSAFGRLSVAFLIARYLGLLADWGASVRGARDVARGDAPRSIGALIARRTQVSLVLAVVFAVGAWVVGEAALAPLAVVLLARGMNRDWLSLGRERGVASGGSSLAQGLALVGMALLADTVSHAAAALAGGYAVGLAVSFVVNRAPAGARARGGAPVRVDGWILGSVLADQVTLSADTLLLAWLRTASLAGIYAAVYRIPNAWMTLIGLTAVGSIASTARAVAQGAHDDAKALQRRAVAVGAKASVAVLASAVPAYFLVPTVFGDAYAAGRTPLLILMGATALMAITASMQPLYLALAKDRDVLSFTASGAVVNVGVNAFAIPLWGMVGAATATFVAQAALLAVITTRLRRLLP